MKKTSASLLAAATIAVTLAATATDASAQWRGRRWGWGPGVAAGIVGGAIIAGAIGPRRRLYRPAGASLPRLCCTSLMRRA
jgi:hypothetical protein